jgi:endoglucanase
VTGAWKKRFRSVLCGSVVLATFGMSSGPALTQACGTLSGVNLAGAEFGQAFPGVFGQDYTYPTRETIDYFADKGATIIRLPFSWPRLQRNLNAPLDAAELVRLRDTVAAIKSAGMTVLLDPHDYARYKDQVIGSPAVPFSAFADFWSRLARQFAGDDKVIFSLTNEPYDMPARQWLRAANAGIAAIRATGSRQLILVPGVHYTGAHSWQKDWPGGNNGLIMQGVRDSANNFAYDFHQYLDEDYSGTARACTKSREALEALEKVTRWMDKHDARGFLGEFGSSNRPECLLGIARMANFVNSRPDRWIGWTYWAAGDWWPEDDPLSVQPSGPGDLKPQLAALLPEMQKPVCGN